MKTKQQSSVRWWAVCTCIMAMSTLAGPALADPIKIMPLGDSNTGIDPADFTNVSPNHPAFSYMNKYREPLANLLRASGYTFDFVGTEYTGEGIFADRDHEGHGGYRVDQILYGFNLDGVGGINDWLDQLAAAGQLPDIVLLMIGTNDILQGSAYRSAAPGHLRDLIDLLTARLPQAGIIVATVPPLTFSQPQWNQYVEAYNRQITGFNSQLPGIVAEKVAAGQRVYLADIYSALTFGDIQSDSIHLSGAGFDKAAQVWHDSIVAVAVPEPASLALLSAGTLFLLARLRRRRLA